MTLLDDFLARNGDAIAQLSIADQLKLSQILLDSVGSALFGKQDSSDEEDYECIEDDE
ncbi:hypothetical protein [Pseudanabaena sp. PCC 6802]|uniref:hypothetical protein n=1 Tax=Pseudanabaena sp. PCC 6802 TaxID=118173 RepID=UPI00034AF006|nr:hypothetical protein [Pseudanabaena sp. PCC 6802]